MKIQVQFTFPKWISKLIIREGQWHENLELNCSTLPSPESDYIILSWASCPHLLNCAIQPAMPMVCKTWQNEMKLKPWFKLWRQDTSVIVFEIFVLIFCLSTSGWVYCLWKQGYNRTEIQPIQAGVGKEFLKQFIQCSLIPACLSFANTSPGPFFNMGFELCK